MNREANIARFEAELSRVNRPGMDKLLDYIRKSDFYTAPASTRFHLSCEGGLLQHSLNVLDALRYILPYDLRGYKREYKVANKTVFTITDESVVLIALLHDICKTYFYKPGTRNVKNEQTGKWEKVPCYTVEDKMPLGHGDKSAMLIKEYIHLDTVEMYAIWWHMGMTDQFNIGTFTQALTKYPILWAVHTADMIASYMMEDADGNKPLFTHSDPEAEAESQREPDMPPPPEDEDAEPVFEEAEAR